MGRSEEGYGMKCVERYQGEDDNWHIAFSIIRELFQLGI